jgi:hypothetical protein
MTEQARWIPTVFGGQREIRRGRLAYKPWTTWVSSKRSAYGGTEVPGVPPRRRPSHPAGHWIAGGPKSVAPRVSPG